MKLKSKLKIYEEFTAQLANEAAGDSSSVSQINSVAIDQTKSQPSAAEIIRTEVIRDVDTILNNLIELSDRVEEANQLEIDELYEELFSLMNVDLISEGILDIIKSPIKYTKIQANMKKYQKILVQKAVNNVDYAKKKEASDVDTDSKDPAVKKKMEVLKQANLAKNQALKDQESAVNDRMAELAKGDEGLGKIVSLGKSKSKLNAAKVVMKAASGEEAKQLKLEIDTLEDRIAGDEQSIKDYTKSQEPKSQEQGVDGDVKKKSDDQLDGSGYNENAELDGSGRSSLIVTEALKAGKPNEVETIEVDMSYEDGDLKDVKAIWKQFNLKVEEIKGGQGIEHEVTGKKKDILAYLQSEYYEMDAETIEEFYPELLESKAKVKESTVAKIYEGMSIAERFKALM